MHVYYGSDDDEANRPSTSAAAARPPPLTAPQLLPPGAQFSCVSSLRTDFGDDQTYVFDMASSATGLVAASLSNMRIKLYKFSETGLEFVGDLTGHSGRITGLRFDLPEEPHLLHSSSADGTVRGWDLRSGQQVEGFQARGRELLCASTNGVLVAAGGGDDILFWDRKKAQALTSFGDTHAQDVTQVSFHPVHRQMLLSGSEDGLVAVFDTAPGLDEDEGFKAALNIDNSVARFGFYGAQGSKLWVTSGTESFHLWEWAAACDDEAAGGNGALADVIDAREQLRASAAAGGALGAELASRLDYLIGCEYSPVADQLWMMAGNNGGTVGLFPVVEPRPAAVVGSEMPEPAAPAANVFAPPQGVLARGHDEVVRSVLWPNASGSACLSGGEDSRICVWQLLAPGQAHPQRLSGSTSSSDGAVRRQGQLHARRKAPY